MEIKKWNKRKIAGLCVVLSTATVLYYYRSNLKVRFDKTVKKEDLSPQPQQQPASQLRYTTIRIVYGSQSGTAEDFAYRLCSEINLVYSKNGLHKCYVLDPLEITNLDDFFNVVNDSTLNIFIVSTYGEGNPTSEFDHIHTYIRKRNDFLNQFNFCVLGLGSSTYTYFNRAGRTFFRNLSRLQGNVACEYTDADDTKDNERTFEMWVHKCILPIIPNPGTLKVTSKNPVTCFTETPAYMISSELSIQPINLILQTFRNSITKTTQDKKKICGVASSIKNFAKNAKWFQNSFLVEVSSIRELNQVSDAYKESTKHIEFNLYTARQMPPNICTLAAGTSDMIPENATTCIHKLNYWTRPVFQNYKTGMTLSVQVPNSVGDVERVFRVLTGNYKLRISLDDVITLNSASSDKCSSWLLGQSIRTVLTYGCHLSGPVKRHTLRLYSSFLKNKPQKKMLLEFIDNSEYFTLFLKQYPSLCDCLEIFFFDEHLAGESVENFLTALQFLPPPQPRSYSLSSSAYMNPRLVSIAVRKWSHPVFTYSPKQLRHAWQKGLKFFVKMLKCKSKALKSFDGFASSYLCSERFCHALVQILDSTLKFPRDTVPTAVILICTGTGLGPIRGYLMDLNFKCKQRYSQNKSLFTRAELGLPESVILCFGSRHPNIDFIYRHEIIQWLYPNSERPVPLITHFWPAFSRYPINVSLQFQVALQKSIDTSLKQLAAAPPPAHRAVDTIEEEQKEALFSSCDDKEKKFFQTEPAYYDLRNDAILSQYLKSIDTREKNFGQYVQDVIKQKSELLSTLMETVESVYFFVCGSASMGTQVQNTLTEIFQHTELTSNAWKECKDSGRFCMDVW